MSEKPKRFSVAEASADIEWGRHRLGQTHRGIVVVDGERFRLLLDDLAAALEVVKAARKVRQLQDADPGKGWLDECFAWEQKHAAALVELDAALDKWKE